MKSPLAAIFLAALFSVALNAWIIAQAHYTDFVPFYAGARLAGTDRLYDREAIIEEQTTQFGIYYPEAMNLRPPIYYTVISPLGKLSRRTAERVWTAVMAAAVVGFLCVYPFEKRLWLILATAASFPIWVAVGTGQDVPLYLLAFGLAMWARSQGHNLAAGLCLSIMANKPHLILFVPLVLLLKREWSILAGMLLGGAFALIASFGVAGLDWPSAYLGMVLDPNASPRPFLMPNYLAIADAIGLPALEYVLGFATLLMLIHVVRKLPLERALPIALLANLLCSHHAYVADCILVIPALLYLASEVETELARTVGLLALLPIFYIACLNGLGALVAVLLAITFMAFYFQTKPHWIAAELHSR